MKLFPKSFVLFVIALVSLIALMRPAAAVDPCDSPSLNCIVDTCDVSLQNCSGFACSLIISPTSGLGAEFCEHSPSPGFYCSQNSDCTVMETAGDAQTPYCCAYNGFDTRCIPLAVEAEPSLLPIHHCLTGDAESNLENLRDTVAALPDDATKGKNMGSALLAKIDNALAQIDAIEAETDPTQRAELINSLTNKLTHDILSKGDGCGTEPDQNDWLTDCTAQRDFQLQIKTILIHIGNL